MSQNAIRFKDATVQITVDGKKQLDSFTLVESFDITPDAEIIKSQHAGEKRQTQDINIKGYDFRFTTKESSKAWQPLWRRIEDADRNGTPLPTISIVVSGKYRNGGGTGTAVLHGDLVMKLDSRNLSGSEYNKLQWSGSCQNMRTS